MLGIKQDALDFELRNDWNQQKASLLKQKEAIESSLLQQVAQILKVPVEAFENFNEEQTVNIIASTFGDNAFNYSTVNINPIETILQLHQEKIAIYERMLTEKDEMMLRLENLLQNK